MNPNPWDPPFPNALTHDFDRPCGRPKGHDNKGGKGAQWGNGHAEHPSDEDPPTKLVVLRRYWEADNPPMVMKIRYSDNNATLRIIVGNEIVRVDHDTYGWEGMRAISEIARGIAKATGMEIDPS